MTAADPHPAHTLPGGGDYRCRRTWRNGGNHVCWLPPGHQGPHRCTIGRCAEQPTETPNELGRAS